MKHRAEEGETPPAKRPHAAEDADEGEFEDLAMPTFVEDAPAAGLPPAAELETDEPETEHNNGAEETEQQKEEEAGKPEELEGAVQALAAQKPRGFDEDLAKHVRAQQGHDPELTEGALVPPPPVRKGGGIGLIKVGRRLVLDAGRRQTRKGGPAKFTKDDALRFLRLLSAAHDVPKGAGCSGVLVLAPDQKICVKTTVPMLQERNVPICGAEDMGYPFVVKLTVGGCITPLP